MKILHRSKVTIPQQRKGGFKMPHYLMQHFAVQPFVNDDLMEIHKTYYDVAFHIDALLDDSAEKTVALRKLLESKDAALRSMLIDLNNAERDKAVQDMAKKLYPHPEPKAPDL